MNPPHSSRRSSLTRLAGAALALCAPLFWQSAAHAQAYPSKPLRWIVPYAAGGGTDVVARLVAKRLEKELGQPVVVENVPGGNTLIAASALQRAPADGYTFMAVAADTLTIVPHLQKVPYDVYKDFSYTGLIATYPAVLIARKEFSANTPEETIALIRSRGTGLNYATYGAGSVAHVGMAQLLQRLGTDMTAVPYKGGAPALQDLLGGRVDLIIGELTTFAPHVQGKALKAIALTGKTRLDALPGVPTLAESGVPGFDWSTWLGTIMRSDVPPQASTTLSRALEKAMADTEIRQQLEARSIQSTYLPPAAFQELVFSTDRQMEKVIKDGNIAAN